jgi:hypothetical protein
VTPVLLELWSDSVGKDHTRSAIAQAVDIVHSFEDSGGEALACDFLNYREPRELTASDDAGCSDIEKVRDERRRRLRDFFAALADGLRAHA